jgi:hypothetical protein
MCFHEFGGSIPVHLHIRHKVENYIDSEMHRAALGDVIEHLVNNFSSTL